MGETADEPPTDLSEVQRLESTHPSMPLGCRLRRALLTVAFRVLLLAAGGWWCSEPVGATSANPASRTLVFVCSVVLRAQRRLAGEVPLEEAAGGVQANVRHGGANCW